MAAKSGLIFVKVLRFYRLRLKNIEYVKEKMIRSQVWIKKVVEIVHVEM